MVRSIRAGGLLGVVAVIALSATPVAPTVLEDAPLSAGPVSLPSIGTGVDISFPQCASLSHVDLPAQFPFAIVGVNGGIASRLNPCFQSEYNSALLLAGITEQPHAAVYVNTGNPALAADWWPAHDKTKSGTRIANPDGSCTHKAGAACAYVYGYSMAQADIRYASRSLNRLPRLWWLDVETSNSWQPDLAANAASLSGMVDYFHSKALSVGIYSTSYQWKKIAGVTSAESNLAGLRSWLAGGSPLGAPADCEKDPLTPNGWVAMVQYVSTLDNDVSCRLFHTGHAAISASNPLVSGGVLAANTGNWGQGVSFTYQWRRDGSPIKHATDESYVPAKSDVGAEISLSISGRGLGYSTKTLTSASVLVLGKLTTQPVHIEGKVTNGSTLTAVTKPWSPAPVTLFYAWYRGGTLVESGSIARQYVVTGVDVGQAITLTITGTAPGYASATQTAVSSRVAQ